MNTSKIRGDGNRDYKTIIKKIYKTKHKQKQTENRAKITKDNF